MKSTAILTVMVMGMVAVPAWAAPALSDYRDAVMADGPIVYLPMDEEPVGGPEIIQQQWSDAAPINAFSDGDPGPATTLVNTADGAHQGAYYTANTNAADGIATIAPADTVWGAAGNSTAVSTFASRGFAALPYDLTAGSPTGFTLEGWIRVDWASHSKTRVLLSLNDTNDPNHPEFYLGVDRTDDNGTGAMVGHVRISGPKRTSVMGTQSLEHTVVDPTWYHLAAVFEENAGNGNTDVTLYLDGAVEVATTTVNRDFSDVADGLNYISVMATLGANGPGTPYSLGGVDELAVFDKALDATAISNHYNGIVPGPDLILGDVDLNTFVDAADIDDFVAVLQGSNQDPQAKAAADCDENGTNDAADIAPFITILQGGGAASGHLQGVPEPTTMALLGLGGLLALRRRRG